MSQEHEHIEPLLVAEEVAAMFRVHASTVIKWTRAGKLRAVRTPGGGYRYIRTEVEKVLAETLHPKSE